MLLILLFRHESEVDRLKSACVQAPVGLHVSLGPPEAADVGETQWQFSTADRFFVGAGTCASSNCSLYTTNGMLQTGFKPVDTNRCVCKEPKPTGAGTRTDSLQVFPVAHVILLSLAHSPILADRLRSCGFFLFFL
ncbi:hypothetical protein AVEN_121139-1 [Araneus ventricosus]|uniref:Uncharacterized protein n=1 Tax=Araneus ventricosus TaxID=182803 RepID=A0A4Y2DZM1_ARAVE|nr:hypothetical protein AVEN_121139-1 [Araneus ventricosus]